MAVKVYKPKTPGTRHKTSYTFEEITKTTPERSLIVPLKKRSGRNMYGRITVRHRGGAHKRYIRLVDFKRDKLEVPATVAAIEYDPNRTARLALLHYADGEKRYIVAPVGLMVGDKVLSGEVADIRPGNSMALANIPVGTTIHNIELQPGKGGQMVRSAGTSAQLLAKEGKYVQVLVSDTGKGISKNLYKKIFEPGYTTKRRGWGLGLSLTKRIVEDYHNGKIYVEKSDNGNGTTMSVLLHEI